jgi:MFS family permease
MVQSRRVGNHQDSPQASASESSAGETGLRSRALKLSGTFSRPVWMLLAADLLAWIGYGLVLPFEAIYLTTVRDMDPAIAGLIVGLQPAVSLVASPVAGELADRRGPRRLLAPALLLAAGGALLMSLATTPTTAAFAATLTGCGFAAFGVAVPTLIAVGVPAARRSSVFSVRYAGLNLGLSFGVFLGASLAANPSSGLAGLFQIEAAVFAVCALILPIAARGVSAHHDPKLVVATPLGWAYLVRDRAFARVWTISFLVRAFAVGQVATGLSLLAVVWLGLRPDEFAIAVGGNTIMVAALQLPALRLLRSRRRSSALLALAVGLGGVWLVVAVGTIIASHAIAVIAIALAGILVGIGETVLPLTIPALTNDLAPDVVRARYNAASGLASSLGFAVGPLAAGITLQVGGPTLYLTAMLSAAVLIGLLARQLAGQLSTIQDTIG